MRSTGFLLALVDTVLSLGCGQVSRDSDLDDPRSRHVQDPIECEAAEPCVHSYYDAENGRCATEFVTTACDDGSACTVDDSCDGEGQCVGDLCDCDDGIACTIDSCDREDGSCDDENPCTVDSFDTTLGVCVSIVTDGVCDDALPS